jgi:ADP-heptose:LPS heptosyltransferase
MREIIRTDCRHYRVDRPCRPHKESGAVCQGCQFFDEVKCRVLLIKLGAMGDVLRTTALLEPIRNSAEGIHITWLISGKNREVVDSCPGIDRVWTLEAGILPQLTVEEFDWVINLDLSAESLGLCALARGEKKSGYTLAADGSAQCCTPAAGPYLEMSYWDPIKKANQKTYQELMLDILEVDSPGSPPEIPKVFSGQKDKQKAAGLFEQSKAPATAPRIGLNLGAAGRWRWKKWTPDGFTRLGRLLWEKHQATLLALGGPSEAKLREQWLADADFPVIDAGHNNTYREFAAIVEQCDVLVTGDTMALHLALAMQHPRVVALFGPTSMAEVELYGRGEALAGEVPCLCCYRQDCDVRPSCMQSLSAETVYQAVLRQLGKNRRSAAEADLFDKSD